MAALDLPRSERETRFAGAIPRTYNELLVPLIFEPYARDLVERVCRHRPATVLEVAAGTGVVTRLLAAQLPGATSIVATDLNEPMLEEAARAGTARPVAWQQADVMSLPFPEHNFDVVVCQFGAMFFPDRPLGFAEVRRVLRPGGVFLFNTWDRIEANVFTHVIFEALVELHPDNPPLFIERTPHGYHDPDRVRADLASAGFSPSGSSVIRLAEVSRGPSARVVAEALCQGTPIRAEMEALGSGELQRATDAAERALLRHFGDGPIEGALSAFVASAVA